MSAKNGTLLILLLIFSLPAWPQASKPKNLTLADYKTIHFGYSVGLNTASMTVIQTNAQKKDYRPALMLNPGININLITDYRLSKNLNFRFLPGIQFASRILSISSLNGYIPSGTIIPDSTWQIESVYVDLPILLKYRAVRVNNYAPYLIAGINPRFDLIGTKIKVGATNPPLRMLNFFDLYTELGVGVDFYLAQVKVATELKFSVGMFDIFHYQADHRYQLYTAGINQVFSRLVILAFHVEQSR